MKKARNQTRLCRCGAIVKDAYLCQPCTNKLRRTLAELPHNLDDLAVTITRQDNLAGSGAPLISQRMRDPKPAPTKLSPSLRGLGPQISLPSTPWPIGIDAAILADEARNTLTTIVREMCETRGLEVPNLDAWLIPPAGPACGPTVCDHDLDATCVHSECRHDTCRAIRRGSKLIERRSTKLVAHWLLTNIEAIRHDESALVVAGELEKLRDRIEYQVDRRDPELYAGRCDAPDMRVHFRPVLGALCRTWWCDHDSCQSIRSGHGYAVYETGTCGADLYGRLEDTEIECPTCGLVYNIGDRKNELLAQVPDELARSADIAAALSTLLEPVTTAMIRQMVYRKEITGRGVAADGVLLYRVGDVIEVLSARKERREAKRKASA